ncbi:MAG: hypothetical protein GY797_24275 [Deltaproteobacteria bacterium]|nr:hypothetical protein [Deltaproteobacteria bacterium]
MKLELLLTAGVTSAIVSGLISLIVSITLHRYQRRKDRSEFKFPRLLDMRRELEELERYDWEKILIVSDGEEKAKLGTIAITQIEKNYRKCIDIHDRYAFLLPKKTHKELSLLRRKFGLAYIKANKTERTSEQTNAIKSQIDAAIEYTSSLQSCVEDELKKTSL